MQLHISSFAFFCVILLIACAKSKSVVIEPQLPATCGQSIVVDAKLYQNAPDDPFQFQSAKIDGNCLKLVVQYGGGCEKVTFKLIDASVILESFPVQRNLRLSLEDNDHCEALITHELQFDLTPLQVEGIAKIAFNLQGFPEKLIYQY